MPYARRTGLHRNLVGNDDLSTGVRSVRCQRCSQIFSAPLNSIETTCLKCKSQIELDRSTKQIAELEAQIADMTYNITRLAKLQESNARRELQQERARVRRARQKRKQMEARRKMMIGYFLYGPGKR